MLLGMEAHAQSMVTGQRAHIIYLQASEVMLVPKFAPKAGDAAHSFEERRLGYQQIAQWAPDACNGDARYDVLHQFVARMEERFRCSVKIYQTYRRASSGAAIIPIGRRADEYETDIRQALLALALDEEDRAMATNKEQDAIMARLDPPSSKQELVIAKLKAEVASYRAAAARPPPTARTAVPPPSAAALSVSVAATPVVRRAPPPPSKEGQAQPQHRRPYVGQGMRLCNNCESNPIDNGTGLGKRKHLHRQCKVKPTPSPLRGRPQGAGAGGVDPAKHNAPRPATAKAASPGVSWADSVVPAPALGVSTAVVPNNQQYATDFRARGRKLTSYVPSGYSNDGLTPALSVQVAPSTAAPTRPSSLRQPSPPTPPTRRRLPSTLRPSTLRTPHLPTCSRPHHLHRARLRRASPSVRCRGA